MRPIRTGLVATALLLGIGLLGAVGTAAVLTVSDAAAASAASAKPDVDRTITDSRITESSGLTPSLLHPGVLWTHNDSGNPPKLYAIGTSGRTKATLTVRGEPNLDWEAISSFRGRPDGIAPGAALIAVGDIGDNNAVHPSVRIAIVREPAQLRTESVRPIRVLRLRYPGGPRDAETLLSDPATGQLYIVSKSLFSSTLYAVPKSVWPGGGSGTSRLTTMTKVATMSAGFITDGSFLPNGRILLRGYGQVFVVDRPSAVDNGVLRTLAKANLPDQDQGESIAVVAGGAQALIGSEGRREPVLRIPVPTVAGDNVKPAATATLPANAGAKPSGPSSGGDGTVAAAEPVGSGVSGQLQVWAEVIFAGFALLLLTVGAVLFWTRND